VIDARNWVRPISRNYSLILLGILRENFNYLKTERKWWGEVRNTTFNEGKKHISFLPSFEGSQAVPAPLLLEVNLRKGKVLGREQVNC
jgi:hypothetical protein